MQEIHKGVLAAVDVRKKRAQERDQMQIYFCDWLMKSMVTGKSIFFCSTYM